MEPDTLSYADAQHHDRPRLVLLLVALVGVAALLSELHYAVRPTTLQWERWWIFGTLPLTVLAGVAAYIPFDRERIWLVVAAFVALTAAMIPIGESWDAITVSFRQERSLAIEMIGQQLVNQIEPLALIVSGLGLAVTASVLRLRQARGLRVATLLPTSWLIVAALATMLRSNVNTALNGNADAPLFIVTSIIVGWMASTLLCLPLVPRRWARIVAVGLLVGCVGYIGVWAYAVIDRWGWLELIRLRELSNTSGRVFVCAAPALAVLLTRAK